MLHDRCAEPQDRVEAARVVLDTALRFDDEDRPRLRPISIREPPEGNNYCADKARKPA